MPDACPLTARTSGLWPLTADLWPLPLLTASSRLPHGLLSKPTSQNPNVLPVFKFLSPLFANLFKGFTGLQLKSTNVYADPHGFTG